MKSWLFKNTNSEAKLFEGEVEIEEALKSGEWKESPADCEGGEHTSTGPGIGEVAIEDYKGLTVEDFKSRFTVKELKVIAKNLGVAVANNANEEKVAQALVDALTKIPE